MCICFYSFMYRHSEVDTEDQTLLSLLPFFNFFYFFYRLVGCLSIAVWTHTVLGVLYACVLYLFVFALVQRN